MYNQLKKCNFFKFIHFGTYFAIHWAKAIKCITLYFFIDVIQEVMERSERMKKAVTVACILGIIMLFGSNANALSTVVETTPYNLVEIPGVSEFATTGADMAGMSVTVYSSYGLDIQTWQIRDDQSGGAFGRGWSLTQSGDTYKSPWIFSVSNPCISVYHLSINAIVGGTVFDLTGPEYGNDSFGTDGSLRGWTFEALESSHLYSLTGVEPNILALYSDIVKLEGAQGPLGDLYGSLDINLGDLTRFSSGSMLQFFADTDTIAAVPEPATMVLLGAGLLCLASISKRRLLRRE